MANKKNFYAHAKAKRVVKALGIKSILEYRVRYSEDSKLPAAPDQVYAGAGWKSWRDLFGMKKTSAYSAYGEAQEAVQKLGIKNIVEYRKRYREDPRLPSSPNKVYAGFGWVDWFVFFGKRRSSAYLDYVEAQKAAQALGIKTRAEYIKRFREDGKLPAFPHITYSSSGWVSYYEFLGSENPDAQLANYPIMLSEIERWVKAQSNIYAKKSAARDFLSFYYKAQCCPDDPRYLLLRRNPFNIEAYQQFIESLAEYRKKNCHSAIRAFFGWLLDEYCTDTDADERVVLPEYRNPFVSVLAGFSDSLPTYRPNQSTKPPLGYEFILRARNYLVPKGEQVLHARPKLKDLPHLQDFFASRFDWIYVDESFIDRNDPNCVWRIVPKADRKLDGQRKCVDSYQIWSPVRFVALYTLLRFPLRGQQILWLDSGEADEEIAVLHADGVRWEKNIGILAGKGTKRRSPQAALQRGEKDAPRLYVTTNKTGYGNGGYVVEWIPDDLVYWFLLLRDWQAKYNPLSGPTPWSGIKLRAEANENILQARGTQCFLFRTDGSGQPLFTTTAFSHTLPALLYKIQRAGENLASEVCGRPNGRPRYISPYTPHCLRVSLITAFIADGDAPIQLVSKLVGHASLVMTIYYTKLNNVQMRRVMGETEKRAAQIATERYAETIRSHGFQSILPQLIATEGNRSILGSDVYNSACVTFDCGICPKSAAACHIGGDPVSGRKIEGSYGPVEAGYLGQKNCPRCRFFVTGVPFLGGLVALANEIALEIHNESARFNGYATEIDRLEQAFYDACQKNQPDNEQARRKQAHANQQQSAAKLDLLLKDYIAVNHYVQGCLKIINESEQSSERESGIRLIVASDLAEISVEFEESEMNYHLLAEICQNAVIFRSGNPSRAVPLISQAIDRMAENNGLAPAMFKLDDDQKLAVANELNKLLLQRLGSWEKIDSLFSGDLMLLDIDAHEPELTRISIEIKKLLSNRCCSHQLRHEASSQ